MDNQVSRVVARILKVNHAGEYGAIRIYRTQIMLAKLFYPSIVKHLQKMCSHEVNHCRLFSDAMPSRNAKPCRLMFLWSYGGRVLGFVTGLFGKKAVWVCTAAIEKTVHRHLDEQLNYLKDRDQELFHLIQSIQAEELQHLDHAEGQIDYEGPIAGLLRKAIVVFTEVAIWMSTSGDSRRLAKDLEMVRKSSL